MRQANATHSFFFFLEEEEHIIALNETEQLVLLALIHLGEDAYGMTVRRQIEKRSGRSVSIAAVYACLDRLSREGHAESWLSEPRAERGGRARKHFRITPSGGAALEDARRTMDRMWEGVDELPGESS